MSWYVRKSLQSGGIGRLKEIRIKPSQSSYNELWRLEGPYLQTQPDSQDEVVKIIKKIVSAVNRQRVKSGIWLSFSKDVKLKVPKITFTGRGQRAFYSDYENRVNFGGGIFIPTLGTIVHEMAHWAHFQDALYWMIPAEEFRNPGHLDCHGSQFLKYQSWIRDYMHKTKGMHKYLARPDNETLAKYPWCKKIKFAPELNELEDDKVKLSGN